MRLGRFTWNNNMLILPLQLVPNIIQQTLPVFRQCVQITFSNKFLSSILPLHFSTDFPCFLMKSWLVKMWFFSLKPNWLILYVSAYSHVKFSKCRKSLKSVRLLKRLRQYWHSQNGIKYMQVGKTFTAFKFGCSVFLLFNDIYFSNSLNYVSL